jgi:hypothetical protein
MFSKGTISFMVPPCIRDVVTLIPYEKGQFLFKTFRVPGGRHCFVGPLSLPFSLVPGYLKKPPFMGDQLRRHLSWHRGNPHLYALTCPGTKNLMGRSIYFHERIEFCWRMRPTGPTPSGVKSRQELFPRGQFN